MKANKIFDNIINEWIYPIMSSTGRTIKDPGVPGSVKTAADNISRAMSKLKKPMGKAGQSKNVGFTSHQITEEVKRREDDNQSNDNYADNFMGNKIE